MVEFGYILEDFKRGEGWIFYVLGEGGVGFVCIQMGVVILFPDTNPIFPDTSFPTSIK